MTGKIPNRPPRPGDWRTRAFEREREIRATLARVELALMGFCSATYPAGSRCALPAEPGDPDGFCASHADERDADSYDARGDDDRARLRGSD